MKVWIIVFIVGVLALVVWQLKYTLLIGIKEPVYTAQKKEGYELRTYLPYITASVTVPGAHGVAANEGFRILAGYIFGNNSAKTSLPMTTPVLQESSVPVKLAMTVPVLIGEGAQENEHRVSFVMPAEYTLENLPRPNDTRIVIESQPKKRVAAYRFGWYPTVGRIESHKKTFAALLARDGVRTHGVMIVARYNPPWVLPFLLRNELLIEVQE